MTPYRDSIGMELAVAQLIDLTVTQFRCRCYENTTLSYRRETARQLRMST